MFLKNKNIIFKIRRSKVTDYAALSMLINKNNKQHICVESNFIRLSKRFVCFGTTGTFQKVNCKGADAYAGLRFCCS